ncbi:hypothetical protein EON83_25070 [bacterium]|nr:MAG: hypothetical protein EON83_25070 [bacterium]
MTPLLTVASLLLVSTATLLLWNRVSAQPGKQAPWTKRELALRQRCLELQQRGTLESFFTRIDKVRDAKRTPIEGIAEVETTATVISMRVQGLAESPKRKIKAGDTFRIVDRHYSLTYKVVRVNQEGVLFSFDAKMPMAGDGPNFKPEWSSGKGRVQLSYKIPYMDAKPWLKTKGR